MSEEKVYVVKNDAGDFLGVEPYSGGLSWFDMGGAVFSTKKEADQYTEEYGGNVVALVQKPEKVVISKEQAEIVEDAHDATWPAGWIDDHADDIKYEEELLMNAYVNGYTVEKEKKYRVIVPRSWWYDDDAPLYLLRDFTDGMQLTVKRDNPSTVFTKKQLNAFELDGAPFKKEEVTDDER